MSDQASGVVRKAHDVIRDGNHASALSLLIEDLHKHHLLPVDGGSFASITILVADEAIRLGVMVEPVQPEV